MILMLSIIAAVTCPLLQAVPVAGTPGMSDYRLGPGDLLEVTVFEEESLNRIVRVGPDGTISLPLLGSVQAAGKRKNDLERLVVSRLADRFLFDPHVSILVKEHRSGRVAVLGAVVEPGSYEMLGGRTLLEAISEAGGLNANAGSELFLYGRGSDGTMTRSGIDLNRLMHEGDATLNMRLSAGDIIHIPVQKPLTIYMYGALSQPGTIEAPARDGVTLLQAIARAGGPGQRAALERITIIRTTGDDSLRLTANLKRILEGKDEDVELMADDVVVVPERFF